MDNREKKLVIVDANGLLVTAFWGTAPPQMQRAKDETEYSAFYSKLMKTSTGIYTNAVYTMLAQIIKIVREQKPTHMAFVFDKSRETLIRKQWYPAYKANRRISPQALRAQIITAQNALSEMGFKVFSMEGYEADDIAGTLAKKFEKEIPTYLVTKDADYLQLVSENTSVWMVQKDIQTATEMVEKYCQESWNIPYKTMEFNPFIVFSEYQLFPEQIVDMKAIQGDSSDNIPGVNGVSAAAIPLLQKYKTVENIYDAIDGKTEDELTEIKNMWKDELQIKRSPLKNLLAEKDEKTNLSAKGTALLSKKLATIITDVPIDVNLDDLELKLSKEGYYNCLRRLEIKQL